ncbi:transketolase, partial [Gammaproteobacteria bacterium]|nr:transketolase [Gammaproteobacteria bacterium]
RAALEWPHAPFVIPEEIKQSWDAIEKGFTAESAWKEKLVIYEEEYPELAMELVRRLKGQLPSYFSAKADEFIAKCQSSDDNIPSRKASQNCIEAYASLLPELIGGSADLTGSNLTNWSGSSAISQKADGNYIYYGVREFGMSAIATGMALHGGFIPYTATFLIFMEYARNAVRMSALMKQQSIFVYTHDSIGQGEDGPTHQPVEQLASLRTTPNMSVWRPCDNVESAVAWKSAIERQVGPTSLVFSRQNLPHQARSDEQLQAISRGAYILKDCQGEPAVIVLATGSEVAISLAAVETLQAEGIKARLVSMPSVDVFEAQDADYQEQLLPMSVRRRVAVEAAGVDYWRKFVGLDGKVIGMHTFGESAPGPVLMEHFGFSAENIVATVKSFDA